MRGGWLKEEVEKKQQRTTHSYDIFLRKKKKRKGKGTEGVHITEECKNTQRRGKILPKTHFKKVPAT